MSYDRILGHEGAIARLRSLVRLGRVAQAYVFAGPAGIGKRLVATEFARALLCGQGPDACEACDACRRTARATHPELKVISCEEEKKEISIAQVRELIRGLSFASDSRRAVIVDEAEKLNEEAQNALLKTLEEASVGTTILLVTSSPSTLLPTIRSRCQTILFHPLKDEQVARLIGTGESEGRLAVALAEGSPGRARELLEDLREWGSEATEFLSRIAGGDLNSVIENLTKIRDTVKVRVRAKRMLRLTALALREALRGRAGLPPGPRFAPEGWAGHLEIEELAARLEAVVDHELMIDRNASVPLVVENALLRIG